MKWSKKIPSLVVKSVIVLVLVWIIASTDILNNKTDVAKADIGSVGKIDFNDSRVTQPVITSIDDFSYTTVGNQSYIKLAIAENYADYSTEIMQLVDLFERKNPDFQVICYEVRESRINAMKLIDGIWIHHRKK